MDAETAGPITIMGVPAGTWLSAVLVLLALALPVVLVWLGVKLVRRARQTRAGPGARAGA